MIVFLTLFITLQAALPDPKYYSDTFECFVDQNGAMDPNQEGEEWCCGTMANGKRQCDLAKAWEKIAGQYVLCETNWKEALAKGKDLCCNTNAVEENCDVCKSFMVWPYHNFNNELGRDGLDGYASTQADGGYDNNGFGNRIWNDTIQGAPEDRDTWRKVFLLEEEEISANQQYAKAYESKTHPAGFLSARLAEFNNPPVCVYVPDANGRVIEVRVESDTEGNKMCVDDLEDDSLANKNNPGITQSCDDSRLKTCFPDGNLDGQGFAFVITCQDSCEDSDIDLWVRVRASSTRWKDSDQRAETNVEMWCQWGISGDEFSKYDVFPSDLTPPKEPRVFLEPDSTASFSLIFSLLTAFYML